MIDMIKMLLFLKPGDSFHPKDENGKDIYHKTDLCATWEVRLVDFILVPNRHVSVKWMKRQSCIKCKVHSFVLFMLTFYILSRLWRLVKMPGL